MSGFSSLVDRALGYREYLETFELDDQRVDPENRPELTEETITMLQAHIGQMPLYAVTEDIGTVLHHATKSIAGQPLLLTDLPSPMGYVWFESPKEDCPKAIAWAVVGRTPTNSTDGVGIWTFEGGGTFRTGELMFYIVGWGEDVLKTAQEGKILTAFWSFVQSEIVESTIQKPSRPFRRRLKAHDSRNIRVIDLRRVRRKSSNPEHEAQDWQSRWLVGGHWRNQWYSRSQTHRQVWISPYTKGPADKPLVLRQSVYRVSR